MSTKIPAEGSRYGNTGFRKERRETGDDGIGHRAHRKYSTTIMGRIDV